MNRWKSVAIHEAGHVRIAYDFGMQLKRIELYQDKKTNEPRGEVQRRESYIFPPDPLPQTEGENERFLISHCEQLAFVAAGFVAEYMFSGPEQFWKNNPGDFREYPDIDNLIVWGGHKLGEETFANILRAVSKHLSKPEIWSSVKATAELIEKKRKLSNIPYTTMATSDPGAVPEHDPQSFISNLVRLVYEDQPDD